MTARLQRQETVAVLASLGAMCLIAMAGVTGVHGDTPPVATNIPPGSSLNIHPKAGEILYFSTGSLETVAAVEVVLDVTANPSSSKDIIEMYLQYGHVPTPLDATDFAKRAMLLDDKNENSKGYLLQAVRFDEVRERGYWYFSVNRTDSDNATTRNLDLAATIKVTNSSAICGALDIDSLKFCGKYLRHSNSLLLPSHALRELIAESYYNILAPGISFGGSSCNSQLKQLMCNAMFPTCDTSTGLATYTCASSCLSYFESCMAPGFNRYAYCNESVYGLTSPASPCSKLSSFPGNTLDNGAVVAMISIGSLAGMIFLLFVFKWARAHWPRSPPSASRSRSYAPLAAQGTTNLE